MMLCKVFTAGAALSLLLSSAGVSAQRTGTRIGKDATARDASAAMEILANCTVARRPDFVRKWFELLPGTPEEADLLRKEAFDLGACMDSDKLVLDGMELHFKPLSMRYPVAAAWARRHLPGGPLTSPLPTSSDPWFVQKLNALPAGAPVDKATLILQDFGHCVAVNEWGGARALLLSKPDSPEQKAAIATLVPVLGPCLAANAKISLTPANLRIVLAEPVFHILTASAGRQQ